MRYLIIILSALCVFSACKEESKELSTDLINIGPTGDNNRSSDDLPMISFSDSIYDFGKILEGEVVEHVFQFENTGNSDLILSDVQTSCGCTVAKDWSQKPYKPGDKGSITVTFDSDKKAGQNNKTIKVLCNTVPSVNIIKMRGEVIGPK